MLVALFFPLLTFKMHNSAPRHPLQMFSHSRQRINSWSVVLEAAGIDHDILPSGRGWVIIVPPDLARQAQEELAAHRANHEGEKSPAGIEPFLWPRAVDLLLAWFPLVLLVGLHGATGSWYEGNPWFGQGAVDSTKFHEHGEWWRMVTALTLHADSGHLLANVISGAVLMLFLAGTCGYGCGWSLVLLGGACGNLLNTVFRETPHLSIGFSTAVFAMVGLLSGLRCRQAARDHRWGSLAWYVAAGLALLALLGAEGERTDLGAHLFGFAAAIPLGFASALLGLQRWRHHGGVQIVLLFVTLLVPVIFWTGALRVMAPK